MKSKISEMKSYEILKILSDRMNLIILGSTRRVARTKAEVYNNFGLPPAQASRRMKELFEMGLLRKEGKKWSTKKRADTYRSNVGQINMEWSVGKLALLLVIDDENMTRIEFNIWDEELCKRKD